ncbi:Protein of unknown function DUF2169 (plasmid) [Gemmatirosa kalamazoonensis]|uniref:DUF2169 domain-containing protein n=1 Tax=Gemmatirosa kalamazoonensis TaxID=861299 RepID=W0RPR0_9BACT|nr:DUF2169 domain-containing protein [Gemmatirosa kalamazoonensis]AHG92994.1 Protein of unknown function DUF2169 [Gemmatirosa kalamazoonensis]
MLQLKNPTGLAATMFLSPDPDGVDTLYAVVKGTFALDQPLDAAGEPPLAAEQIPVTVSPEHWGDPATSSLKAASDISLLKPATDVLLVGHAHAPNGRPTTWMDVGLAVGPIRKVVRVFGDRVWLHDAVWTPSAPAPFTKMPLVWERAFGGAEEVEGVRHEEPRNPVGAGLRAPNGPGPTVGMPLPNLEDPADPVTSWKSGHTPACFAPLCAHWMPRRRWAGTYDERWQSTRAPYLPTDFDPRFFHLAPADQIAPGHLLGGEPVELHGVSPWGPVRFVLPRAQVGVSFVLDGAEQPRAAVLDTVLIDADAARLTMVWRAALRCDKQVLRVSEIRVAARRAAPGVAAPPSGGASYAAPAAVARA